MTVLHMGPVCILVVKVAHIQTKVEGVHAHTAIQHETIVGKGVKTYTLLGLLFRIVEPFTVIRKDTQK